MIDFIKKNIFLIIIFLITLSLCFITFLTFIDKSFIKLSDQSLQVMLVGNMALLFLLFLMIFKEVKSSLKIDIDITGSKANRKYITFFALFTLIPSILISLFSLFLLSFVLEKYLDKKITSAVNNSLEIAKSYTEEVKTKTQSEIILIAYDLNKSVNFLKTNRNQFISFLNTQKLIRGMDEVHIIDGSGKLYLTTLKNKKNYQPPLLEALEMVATDDRPLKIINAYENQSASIIKLEKFDGKFLYIVKYLDKKISQYLIDSEEAVNFYYTVLNKQTGIKISFVLIYLVVVSLLLFLSITIAIRFSSRFFRSINNLIVASSNIGKGLLNIRVPEIKADKDMEILNKSFNLMIDQLKTQQNKLIINERHEAWESLARKLAHEIKNPLTPIQLSIDSLREKYKNKLQGDTQEFEKYLETINRQIKDIEKLVNEFSNFARMPRPVLRKINIVDLINDSLDFIKMSSKNSINFTNKTEKIFIKGDQDQLNRVFINLIKNSEESFSEKIEKDPSFKGNIDIEISDNNDYINCRIIDNGTGITDLKKAMTPYFTTKRTGTGLGLPIVTKIINEHMGTFSIKNKENKTGAIIKISLPKINA